jgi:hypothetical protein
MGIVQLREVEMKRKIGCVCILVAWFGVIGQPVRADSANSSEQIAAEDLGGGRYRIGAIVVDKPKGRFSVPGAVIELNRPDSPIEFIAVTKGGIKRYEAIFELDTTAVDFNLACILIGLDAKHAVQPEKHFDTHPSKGDAVNVFVSWKESGRTRRAPASEVLKVAGSAHVSDEWVYTGSVFSQDGTYMADTVGTLVGFVHDPATIIEHRSGLGLGDYGAVTYNPDILPPPGTSVTLEVSLPPR